MEGDFDLKFFENSGKADLQRKPNIKTALTLRRAGTTYDSNLHMAKSYKQKEEA